MNKYKVKLNCQSILDVPLINNNLFDMNNIIINSIKTNINSHDIRFKILAEDINTVVNLIKKHCVITKLNYFSTTTKETPLIVYIKKCRFYQEPKKKKEQVDW